MKDWLNDPPTPAENMKPIESGRYFVDHNAANPWNWEIKTADWLHLSRCSFGPARNQHYDGKGGWLGGWTGDSHRYDIFRNDDFRGRKTYAIRWHHGAGAGWRLAGSGGGCDDAALIKMILAVAQEPNRWDLCKFLCDSIAHAEDESRKATRAELYRAFVDGRLKKRKQRGQNSYRVDVEPLDPTRITLDTAQAQ